MPVILASSVQPRRRWSIRLGATSACPGRLVKYPQSWSVSSESEQVTRQWNRVSLCLRDDATRRPKCACGTAGSPAGSPVAAASANPTRLVVSKDTAATTKKDDTHLVADKHDVHNMLDGGNGSGEDTPGRKRLTHKRRRDKLVDPTPAPTLMVTKPLPRVLMLHTGGTLGMDPAASYEALDTGVSLRQGTGGVYAGGSCFQCQASSYYCWKISRHHAAADRQALCVSRPGVLVQDNTHSFLWKTTRSLPVADDEYGLCSRSEWHCSGCAGSKGSGLRPGTLLKNVLALVPELSAYANLELQVVYNKDSSNVGPRDWKRLASILHKCRPNYDAFLVIHGTDTMAYTASALSLMLVRTCPDPDRNLQVG
jgi:Asparaginase, N-terminal